MAQVAQLQGEHQFDLHDIIKCHKKNKAMVKVMVGGILALVVIAALAVYKIGGHLEGMKVEQAKQYAEHVSTNQFLLSTINWETQRTKLILYMRTVITNEWKQLKLSVNMDEAYLIAETNMRECEVYRYIDPLFLMAIQRCESRFLKNVKSPMGARGLNQIIPYTGRLVAGYFRVEYSDTMLHDIAVSTRFAVKLLDFAYVQYGDWEQILACYNGGTAQAYYYKTDKRKMTEETSQYVVNVMAQYKKYAEGFKTYRLDEELLHDTGKVVSSK